MSQPAPSTIRLPAPREWIALAIFASAGLLLGLLFTRGSPLAAFAVPVIGALLWAFYRWPALGFVILLALTCFISFRHLLPGFPIQSLHIPDLLLYLLVFFTGIRLWILRQSWVRTGYEWPLLLFIGAGFVSLLWSLRTEITFFGGFKEYKVVLYYLPVLLIPNLVREEAVVRRLLLGSFAVGAAYGLYVIYQGLSRTAMPSDHSEVFYALESFAGGSGNLLLYWILCVALVYVSLRGLHPVFVALVILAVSYFVLMFHRHMYLAIAFALAVFVAVSWRDWGRVVKLGASLAAIGLLALTAIYWGPPSLGRYAALTAERVVSLKGVGETSTVTHRREENRYAARAFLQHPVVGIGFNRSYRPPIYGVKDHLDWFLHHGYLWILLKTGVCGFVPFLWFYLRGLRRSLTGWRRCPGPLFQAAILGTGVMLLGMALVNFSVAYFMQDWGVLVFALALGLTEAIQRLAPTP